MYSFKQYLAWSVFLTGFFGLVSCAPLPDAKSLKDKNKEQNLPATPTLSNFSYIQSGTRVNENGPFSTARSIYPDMQTGICASYPHQAEITLNGTFDVANTKGLELTGATTTEVTLSGRSYSIKACLPAGASSLSIKAKNSEGNAQNDFVGVSITLFPALKTLAEGHPRYPNPGFRQGVGNTTPQALTSNGVTARQIVLSDAGASSISSTGATGYTMSFGFANIVGLTSP